MTADAGRLRAALAATWPPAATERLGPWTLRRGAGGGKRVSSATASREVTEAEISQAEQAMDDAGQQASFAIGPDDARLDRQLSDRGYLLLDPTVWYQAPIAQLARGTPPPISGFSIWPPLQIQRDLWAEGGVGRARLDVMERAVAPKAALLGRFDDRAASVAFVAVHERVAMLHALEVRPTMRRAGLGRMTMLHAARWAVAQDAEILALLVTRANQAGNALYTALGMTSEPAYHYRVRP